MTANVAAPSDDPWGPEPVDGPFANGSSAVWGYESFSEPGMEAVAEVMAVAPLPAGNDCGCGRHDEALRSQVFVEHVYAWSDTSPGKPVRGP